MTSDLITLLIPTYKNIQTLRGCIGSLLLNTSLPCRVVILNNDPSYFSQKPIDDFVVQCNNPRVSVRHLSGNRGWMGAINEGMAEVSTPYVCLLNDDVLFIPGQQDFWERLLFHMEDPEVAAVGPSSNYVMGMQSIMAVTGYTAFPAYYLIGFCMLLRSDVFVKVGLLDETLPGGDDLDLSIRLRRAGYAMVCEREAYLHHIGSLTGNKVHEGFWNSLQQQDLTNNALIRKHGLKAWYEMLGRDPFGLVASPLGQRIIERKKTDSWELKLRMAGHG